MSACGFTKTNAEFIRPASRTSISVTRCDNCATRSAVEPVTASYAPDQNCFSSASTYAVAPAAPAAANAAAVRDATQLLRAPLCAEKARAAVAAVREATRENIVVVRWG